MHDIKWIRANAAEFDAGLARRGLGPCAKELLELDAASRAGKTGLQELQSRQNQITDLIKEAVMRKEKPPAELLEESKALKERIARAKDGADAAEGAEEGANTALNQKLASLPNLPAADVPEGKDEHDNVEQRKWGAPPEFSFPPKQHFELGEALGLMDFEGAAKLSGSRFVVLKGALAKMERALAAFFLEENTKAGYLEHTTPFLVRDAAAFGTGQLPKFGEDLFHTKDSRAVAEAVDNFKNELHDELSKNGFNEVFYKQAHDKMAQAMEKNHFYLIPTAEVPLTNLVADSIVEEAELPLRMTAHTPCFRSEAGAAGRDTRGMIRQHQFSKVEMVSVTAPEASEAEHERMTAQAEALLQALKLPYRVMLLCTGDMGFSARKTYDIEVWLPGQGAYREISSCSNCGDFQARRMKARMRRKGAKETEFVHTLNGSGLPIGRTMVAILENYQNPDGSITVPEVLRGYMGCERIG